MLNQLHIVPDVAVSSGGLGLAALRYAESVSQAGAKVTLLTTSCSTATLLRPTFDSSKFRLVHVPYHSRQLQNLIELYKSIEALCEQNDFDLLHLHGVWLPLFCVAGFVARRRKIPFVVSPHGCFESWALNHKRLKKSLALMTYQGMVNSAATMFFATAEQEVESIRRLNISQPVVMIPNGVDVGAPPVRTPCAGKRTILFLSRIHPKKGLLDLVEAWAKVRDQNWRIVIAGPDENGHQSEVQAAIAACELESDFEFVGLVDGARKSACFANAELFVLPTYSENFGIAVAEALANELPVITTTGAPWKDLDDHQCGWWVSPGVAGISKALKIAMGTDPAELRLMGERGRQLVSEKYSWDKIGIDALRAYTSMVDHTSPPLDIMRIS
jgi:glycosyltransferase involved in cell wall biosynthesis